MKNIKIPCGRDENNKGYCCLNPDNTWRTNKLYFKKIRIYWHKGFFINIHYEIRCRKCGHMRQQGNHFSFSIIKQLLTGKIYF